ncbi:DUF4350 domain-containing protein [soil metagenome]
MTVSAPTREEMPAGEGIPTLRGRLRRNAFWIVLATALLLITALAAIASVGGPADNPLDPTNAQPTGSRAVFEVLRQQGVDVSAATSLTDTAAAVADPADTTIVLYDASGILGSDQRARLLGLAQNLIVVMPTGSAIEDFAPGVDVTSELSGTVRTAGCDLAAAEKAQTIVSTGEQFTVTGDVDATTCFTENGESALVQLANGDTTVTLLGAGRALMNGDILKEGNAALALNLLGSTGTLVWYIPGAADYATDGSAQTLGQLSPNWVIPLTSLLALAALVAIVWRSRRFGPLVIENLPVVVRSSETMEGRARLYERGNDRLHALDALRVATIDRLAVTCGLSRRATVTEVVDAVSALTARDRQTVAGILIDQTPSSDSELVRLSDELLRLEADTAAATRAR